MRIDDATITLEPRNVGGCLDMAVAFAGRHIGSVLRLFALVAGPSCLLTYLLASRFGLDLRFMLLVAWFASAVLGGLLVAGTASAAFGGPFLEGWLPTTSKAIRRAIGHSLLSRFYTALGMGVLFYVPGGWGWAIGLVLMLSPGIYPGLVGWFRRSFELEVKSLRRLNPPGADMRAALRVEREAASMEAGFGSWLAILLACGCLWLTLFATLDLGCDWLLQFPILLGRIDSESFFPMLFALVGSDPLVLAALMACTLFVYAIGRLAWFFTYVDVRIRRDLWDLELRFVQEARRQDARNQEPRR